MIALGFLLVILGVILILMISSFQSNTRQNFKVINRNIKTLNEKLNDLELSSDEKEQTISEWKTETKTSTPPLQTSAQRFVPKAIKEQMKEDKPKVQAEEKKEEKKTPPILEHKKPEVKSVPVEEVKKEQPKKEEKPKVAAFTSEEKKKAFHGSQEKKEKAAYTETKAPKKERDLEKVIGENWLNKIGIAVLVLGLGFFVKYAIDHNWIGEGGRVAIGMGCGAALIGIAHFLRKKYRAFSSVLIGGGISVFYYTISIAYHDYGIFSQPTAFAIMVGITILSTFLAVIYDRKELAIISLIGGFTTPFMVQGEHENYMAFFTYLSILNAGFLVLSYFKKWDILTKLALGFTVLFFGGWALMNPVQTQPMLEPAIWFSTIFFLEFVGMSLLYNLSHREKFNAFEFILLLGITSFYYGGMMYLLDSYDNGNLQGTFSLGLSAFFFVLAIVAKTIRGTDDSLIKLLLGKVVALTTLAFLVLFEGDYSTFFWSIEACLLLCVARKAKMPLLRSASSLVLSFATVALVYDWMTLYLSGEGMMNIVANKAFITSLVVMAAHAFTFIFLSKEPKESKVMGMDIPAYRMLVGAWLIIGSYLSLLLELNHQVDRITFSGGSQMVIWLYHFIFFLGGMMISRIGKAKLTEQVFMVLSTFAIVSFMILGHQNNIDVRNAVLDGWVPAGWFHAHYLLTGLGILIALQLRRASLKQFENQSAKSGFLMFLTILGIFALCAEVDHLAIYSFADDSAGITNVLRHTQGGGYTVVWGLCSFLLMIYGMRKSDRFLRIFSLCIFTVTIAKLFIYDISSISEAGKIAAFISLGIFLLVISFLYQKLRNLIVDGSFEGEQDKDVAIESGQQEK